ncbi:RpnC/YadD family protein [Singulisphaera rosea]
MARPSRVPIQPRQSFETRLLRYNVLLGERHKAPVQTVAVLLRPESERARLSGVFEVRLPDGRPSLVFHYVVIRAWEKSAAEVLEGGLSTLPLASLARISQEQFPALVHRVAERLYSETTPSDAVTLWTAFLILTGLRYPPEFTKPLIDEVWTVLDLKDSSIYQMILEEGRAKGKLEGRREGEIAGATKVLLKVGSDRFGPPDQATSEAIHALDDLDHITHLIERLLLIRGWDELLSGW